MCVDELKCMDDLEVLVTISKSKSILKLNLVDFDRKFCLFLLAQHEQAKLSILEV